jgi:LysM repeat protein
MKLLRALLLVLLFLPGITIPARAQAFCLEDTYVIKTGDTLFAIAEDCDLSFNGLIGINYEIEDPDLIRPGQIIRLVAGIPLYNTPAGGPPDHGGLQEGGQVYVARRGDSLARIAYLYHTSVSELRRYNPEIGDDLVIQIGQRIQMPPDARREKGWVGVSTRVAGPGDEIEVRVVDFPPYADLDVNVGELFENDEGDLEAFFYVTIDAKTDSRGQARINVTIPFFAWLEERWVIEVLTSEHDPVNRAMSPVITIDFD